MKRVIGGKGMESMKKRVRIEHPILKRKLSINTSFINCDNIFTYIEEGKIAEVENMIKNGADVDMRDGEGKTPIMVAAMHNRPNICELLLKSGASLNLRDSFQRPSYYYAEESPDPCFACNKNILCISCAKRKDIQNIFIKYTKPSS